MHRGFRALAPMVREPSRGGVEAPLGYGAVASNGTGEKTSPALNIESQLESLLGFQECRKLSIFLHTL